MQLINVYSLKHSLRLKSKAGQLESVTTEEGSHTMNEKAAHSLQKMHILE